MPSHLLDQPDKKREKPTPEWVEHSHKLGNHHADRLAGLSASYYALHKDISDPIITNISNVRAIQKRLYTIICNLPNRVKENRRGQGKCKAPSLPELIANSEHVINENDSNMECCVCFSKCSTALHATVKAFLASPCRPNCMVQGMQVHGPISINGATTHPSHNLRYSTHGYYCCVTCGMKAQYRIIKLKDPCRRPNVGPTVHGQNVLKRAAMESAQPQSKIPETLTSQESASLVNLQHQVEHIHNNPENNPEMPSCDDQESVSSGELWRPEYSPYSPADSD